MNKLNVGIYPFEESFVPVIRYKELFDKYRFCLFINHNGDILSEKDIKEKSTYAREYCEIEWDDVNKNSNIDVLLVTGRVELLEWDAVLRVIEEYCKKGVEIWLMGVHSVITGKIKEICTLNNVLCKTQTDIQYDNKMIDYRTLEYSLTQQIIETPIVSVAGVVPVVQKYQLQLDLFNNFKKDGYKVSLIGTGEYNELMGAYSLCDILFCRDLPEVHRIHYFNSFLKEVEKRDTPDVIIIGIDDPLISLSARHPFNYGIYATELYSAFSPDISIIALMNGNYNDDFYDEFERLCHFKYNIDANAYFVSRYVPLSASMYREKLSYAYTGEINNSSDKYSVFSNSDIEQKNIYNFVLEKLQQYGRCEQF